MKLSKVELDLTKELVNIGLAKAADSLSFFIKNTVMLKGLDVSIRALSEIDSLSTKKEETLHLLTTSLKGDVKGVCFFILDNQDVDKVLEVSIPKSINLNSVEGRKMKQEFLLELDNIISAAVITQFANFLKERMFGHVPKYDLVNQDDLNNVLKNEIDFDGYLLYFKVNFITENNELNPEFVWVLDESFIQKIIQVAKEEKQRVLTKQKSRISTYNL